MDDDELSKRRAARDQKAPPDPVMLFVKEAISKGMKMAADQRAEERALRKEVGRIADALTSIASAVRREEKKRPK